MKLLILLLLLLLPLALTGCGVIRDLPKYW
jgi:hypothetical protein